ncbi:hypothetical protein IG631_15773 [Alternaria alternata]|nr:hypothetical protein IG631_15773 [Alternaria alternata]
MARKLCLCYCDWILRTIDDLPLYPWTNTHLLSFPHLNTMTGTALHVLRTKTAKLDTSVLEGLFSDPWIP